jgi:hypothetical protein
MKRMARFRHAQRDPVPLVGAICGAVFGYIFYFLAKENIVGKITEKMDDYGPL